MRPISVAGVLSVTGTGRPKEGVNRVIMVSQKRRKTVMGRVTAKTIVKLGGVEYINFFFFSLSVHRTFRILLLSV